MQKDSGQFPTSHSFPLCKNSLWYDFSFSSLTALFARHRKYRAGFGGACLVCTNSLPQTKLFFTGKINNGYCNSAQTIKHPNVTLLTLLEGFCWVEEVTHRLLFTNTGALSHALPEGGVQESKRCRRNGHFSAPVVLHFRLFCQLAQSSLLYLNIQGMFKVSEPQKASYLRKSQIHSVDLWLPLTFCILPLVFSSSKRTL